MIVELGSKEGANSQCILSFCPPISVPGHIKPWELHRAVQAARALLGLASEVEVSWERERYYIYKFLEQRKSCLKNFGLILRCTRNRFDLK